MKAHLKVAPKKIIFKQLAAFQQTWEQSHDIIIALNNSIQGC